jgi:hypothetical protein
VLRTISVVTALVLLAGCATSSTVEKLDAAGRGPRPAPTELPYNPFATAAVGDWCAVRGSYLVVPIAPAFVPAPGIVEVARLWTITSVTGREVTVTCQDLDGPPVVTTYPRKGPISLASFFCVAEVADASVEKLELHSEPVGLDLELEERFPLDLVSVRVPRAAGDAQHWVWLSPKIKGPAIAATATRWRQGSTEHVLKQKLVGYGNAAKVLWGAKPTMQKTVMPEANSD